MPRRAAIVEKGQPLVYSASLDFAFLAAGFFAGLSSLAASAAFFFGAAFFLALGSPS